MIHALLLSIGQLSDRRIAMVLVKSLLLTLLVFAVAGVGLWYAMHGLEHAIDAWLGARETGWAANAATLVLGLLAGWLLFRAIAVAVVGIFADEVVAAVEAKYYPAALAGARPVPLARSIAMGIGSVGRLIAANLILAPLYLVLLVTGVGTALAFFVVNSWLLGRDLGDMVAARHLPRNELREWRGRTALRRFMLGAAGTGLFLVPILNLVAPVLGAAMATHLFHRGWRE